MKELFLIRHALPAFPNGERICMGRRIDLPLGEEGRMQAAALARDFPDLPCEAVFCSPMKRCLETAQPLSERFHLPIQVMQDLAELDGGEWDGMTFKAIREKYPEYYDHGVKKSPPGGESDEEGLLRIRRALSDILDRTQHYAVVVSHAAYHRLLLRSLLHTEPGVRFPQDYAYVTHLILRDGQWECGAVSVPAAELAAKLQAGRPACHE